MINQVFIVDGTRTPFMRSMGAFSSLPAHELGKFAVNALINQVEIDPKQIDYLCMGNVIQNPATPNIAREIGLISMLPKSTPAHTVSMACISSNIASTSMADMIINGHIDCAIAGGTDTFSDIPIRLSKNLRKILLKVNKSKSLLDKLKIISSLRPKDLKPDIPSPKEFSVDITMGEAGDQLAAFFDVSRKEADAYALLSHKRAFEAWQEGFYQQQVTSVLAPPSFKMISKDDGPRPKSTIKQLSLLKPSFNRFGINTAANSSFFSDGASALLLANEKSIKENSLKPLCEIIDYYYAAGNPLDELLLGPALAVPTLLKRNNLDISHIDVWEVHEAFAGQVLAIVKALSSADFCLKRLGLSEPLGTIPLEKMNILGGSLSLGHPFGATGGRLLLTAGQRLQKEHGKLAVVTGCAAGGLGSAILLKRA